MFDFSNPTVSQDQTLALQSQLLSFMREALVHDKGYIVFSIKDLSSFEFTYYYSDGHNVDVLYEESREETVDRILYTIDCECLKSIRGDSEKVGHILRYLFNYIVGGISAGVLTDKYGVKDHSLIFKPDEP